MHCHDADTPEHAQDWDDESATHNLPSSAGAVATTHSRERWQSQRLPHPTWLYGESTPLISTAAAAAPTRHDERVPQARTWGRGHDDEHRFSVARPPAVQHPRYSAPPFHTDVHHNRTALRLATGAHSVTYADQITHGTRASQFLSQDQDEDRSSDAEAETATAAARKSSRYLREIDRREILQRLADGERQAALAKEFNVSRAAICNLQKHREEVLARTDENPFAKHPKTKQRAKAKGPRRRRASSEPPPAEPERSPTVQPVAGPSSTLPPPPLTVESAQQEQIETQIHQLQSIAMRNLLSSLRGGGLPQDVAQRNRERLLWLLLEEALALVPTQSTRQQVSRRLVVHGYSTLLPPCGVVIDGADASVVQRVFRSIEPSRPLAVARVVQRRDDSLSVELVDSSLPYPLDQVNVFVVDSVSTDAAVVCIVLEALVAHHRASEGSVFFVSMAVTSHVVTTVRHRHPSVTVITAAIEHEPSALRSVHAASYSAPAYDSS